MNKRIAAWETKRAKRAGFALLPALALAAWSGPAMAAEADTAGSATAATADADTTSDNPDIVVTAGRATTGTKTDTDIMQIPQSVSVVTNEQFTDRAAVDFQDIFRYSAGVQTERSGLDVRGDSFAARGFPVVQYLDGLSRMPSFVYGARIEPFTLERAEVLRGPSSTLYGAGGVGGLFNGISKMPRDTFGGEVNAILGTQSRKELQLDVTGPIATGVSARFVGLWRDGHLIHPSQDDNRLLAMPVISFRPTSSTEITLIGLYQKDSLGTQTYIPISKTIGAVNAADRIPIHTFLGEPGFNHMHSEYKAPTLLITQHFGEHVALNSHTRYFDMDTNYAEVYGLSSYNDPTTRRKINRSYYVLVDHYDGWQTDNNLVLNFTTGPFEHQLLVGIDYTYFHEDKKEGFPAAPPLDLYNPVYGVNIVYPPFTNAFQTKNTNLGFYMQEQARGWDRVSLVLGVRHDTVTSKTIRATTVVLPDNKAWTWRAGIVGDIVKGVSPYFNYSESFQPVFGTSFVGIPFVARPGRQYEGGVKLQPFKNSLITVSVYDIKESNYISRDPNNIQNSIQGGEVGSKGFEAEGAFHFTGDLDINAAYSYTRAKWLKDPVPPGITTSRVGFRLENLPEHQASLWVRKGIPLTSEIGMRIGGGVRYNGNKIDSFQNFITPPQTLVDAMIEFTYGKWGLSINGANIFDETVYTSCGRNPAAQEGYCYLARDRTILATLHHRF